MSEIREITRAIVQEIGKRDARIHELELVLFRLHSNAAESEEWIRHEVETVLKVEYGFQKNVRYEDED